MTLRYRQECKGDPYDASMRNLAKAKAKWRQPQPWRSREEGRMIRRFVFQWFTCRDPNKPSGRSWARTLGVSHTWVQKLVLEFTNDSSQMWRMQAASGDPTFAQLGGARNRSREMQIRGEILSSPRADARRL